jgi:hypothetical protein
MICPLSDVLQHCVRKRKRERIGEKLSLNQSFLPTSGHQKENGGLLTRRLPVRVNTKEVMPDYSPISSSSPAQTELLRLQIE